jgi:hypothetical protein
MKTTIRQKKQEIFDAYVASQNKIEELQQQQRVLFGVAGMFFILWCL